MSRFLYENHRGSPTLTFLNVLGVLHVLHVLYVLHVLNMPMDASLACWALFFLFFTPRHRWLHRPCYPFQQSNHLLAFVAFVVCWQTGRTISILGARVGSVPSGEADIDPNFDVSGLALPVRFRVAVFVRGIVGVAQGF